MRKNIIQLNVLRIEMNLTISSTSFSPSHEQAPPRTLNGEGSGHGQNSRTASRANNNQPKRHSDKPSDATDGIIIECWCAYVLEPPRILMFCLAYIRFEYMVSWNGITTHTQGIRLILKLKKKNTSKGISTA